MKTTILFIALFFALLIGQAQQISELYKGLIFRTQLDEWGKGIDEISGQIPTATDTYNVLGKGGEGRRYLENINTSYSSLADDARYDFGTGDFTLITSFTPANITDNGKYLISKEAGGIGYGLYQQGNDIYVRIDDNTHDASGIIGTDILVAGTKITCEVVFNRAGNAVLYLNGSASSSGTLAISTSEMTLDNTGAFVVGNIEAHNQGFAGQIHFVRAFNYALTGTKIANYSKPEYPIEAVDRGATGTVLNVSTCENYNESSFSTFTGASSTGFTAATSSGSGFYAAGAKNNEISFVAGKKYCATFNATLTSGAIPNYLIGDYMGGGWNEGITPISSGYNSFITTSTHTAAATPYFFVQNSASFAISNFRVVQAGCILNLNAEGLGRHFTGALQSGVWGDCTNGVDATVSGAVVVIPPASNLSATWYNATTSLLQWTGMPALTGNITLFGKILVNSFGEGNAGRIFDNSKVVLYTNSTGYLTFSRDGSTVVNSAAASQVINTSYNFAITSTSAGVSNLYINGVLSGTANQAAGTPASGTTWNIGNNAAGSATFGGRIEGVGIIGRILESDGIKLLNETY